MEPDVKPVASPPEMDTAADYTVSYDDRSYDFQTPERGRIVLIHVRRRATAEDDTDADYVPDEAFDGTIPDPVEEAIMTYFDENFGDDMTLEVNLR